ncbi:MAG TPA: ABC transporter ATP-binding protein [Tepidisphaeraceae bacterium]|jgi:iron(III) transport system ATP-binding protein|nr:ABC transporter ATP-binding protein [Tepidisphaeraceae bacterium]
MTSVYLDHITKCFDETVALDDIDLRINAGELFFLLGPSGCGKSTLLRLIAGLHDPTSGRIFFNDRDVTRLHTDQRNAVMCFQSYALWPHMTVRENVRFGLAVRKFDRAEQEKRINEVLDLVQMQPYAQRKPNQLSGGQQQRVALARALAVQPDCLLLDEPLSNLDAKLRHEMRSEIRRICKTAGFTTIYVTHDQKEALSVADRIAVLKDGKLVQVGTPSELYHRPATTFVADFIGQTNLLPGRIVGRAGAQVEVETAAGRFLATSANGLSDDVTISIRPEQMQIARGNGHPGRNRIVGRPIETTFLGEASEHVLLVGQEKLKVISAPPIFEVPVEMTVEFDPEDVVVLAR